MSVQFSDSPGDENGYVTVPVETVPGFAGWLIGKGIVKTKKSADRFLFGLAIVIFVLAGIAAVILN